MFQHRRGRLERRLPLIALVVAALSGSAFAQTASRALHALAAVASPVAERVDAGAAWHMAETVAALIPDSEILVGSGDSMLPLYSGRTVLVVQRRSMTELNPGMTVVFIGDQGRPVAHTLVEKTPRGWIAQGLGNGRADRTLVRAHNYLGTVVRAFTPVTGGAETMAAGFTPELAPIGQ